MVDRILGRVVAAVGLAILVVIGIVGPTGSLAQGVNTVTLDLQGGPRPGTYELTTDQPCVQGGTGGWAIGLSTGGDGPASVSVVTDAEPVYNYLAVSFAPMGAPGDTYETPIDSPPTSSVDDAGDTITLTVSAAVLEGRNADGSSWSSGSGTVTVVCVVMQRLGGGPATEPPSTPRPIPTVPVGGAWSGTVTVTGVIDWAETESGSSGDPGSTYFQTFVRDDRTLAHATDTFTVGGDPVDRTDSVGQVDLTGTAANSGDTLERYVTDWEKQNAGCTWHEQVGSEKSGSWTQAGGAAGYLQVFDDGSYVLDVRPDLAGPDGVEPPDPQLPIRTWTEISDLSANCEGESHDTTFEEAPLMAWASTFFGGPDVNGVHVGIEGRIDVADPGSVLQGSSTWEMAWPEGLTLTVDWDLRHDRPIILGSP